MDNMKLQPQVYHNGALVGNDVHKLTKNENISSISTVFKPLLIKLSDDNFLHMRMSKYILFIGHFVDMKLLFSGIHGSSMGYRFPVNFPVV